MEVPITFENRHGIKLFGMLFTPEVEPQGKRIGIIISVNAIKYRIGTSRLHTLLARFLSGLGYYVMYFDPAGVGDSEGVFEQKPAYMHYYDIQKGKYSEDIKDATTYFLNEIQLDSVILLGLCGGAISVLIAASEDERIDGLILLGIPVLLESIGERSNKDYDTSMITSCEQSKEIVRSILAKLSDAGRWRKVITFRSDIIGEVKTLAKACYIICVRGLQKIRSNSQKKVQMAVKEPVSKHPRFNTRFQESFINCILFGQKMLFIFGELDRLRWIFTTEFQEKMLFEESKYNELCEFLVIRNADHTFASKESQTELMRRVRNWLVKEFPVVFDSESKHPIQNVERVSV